MYASPKTVLFLSACALLMSAVASATTISVRPGQSIQAAITRAAPGDRIELEPGIYKETVYIDKNDITLHGNVRDGQWPILDGNNSLPNGVLAAGHGVTIEYLWIRHYKGNGIMTQGSNNYRILHNVVEGPCFYAIFPQYGKNGLIAYNVVSNSDDAAIYVGMSDNVDVLYNETYGSFSGIEAENSRDVLIEGNFVHDNSSGVMLTLLPGLPVKTADRLIVRHNIITHNNGRIEAPAGGALDDLPSGVGVFVVGTDHSAVEGNLITDNASAGVYIVETDLLASSPDEKMDPFPDYVQLLSNVYARNGTAPQGTIKDNIEAAGRTTGVDVLASGKGHDNCMVDRAATPSLGTAHYSECAQGATTAAVTTMRTAEPVAPVQYTPEQKARFTYLAVCSGCHTYDARLIGPPMITIKALYGKDEQRLASWISHPTHKRKDYPEMPAQDYLPEGLRLALAHYILNELSH